VEESDSEDDDTKSKRVPKKKKVIRSSDISIEQISRPSHMISKQVQIINDNSEGEQDGQQADSQSDVSGEYGSNMDYGSE
jgi:hypothetical protein